MRSNGRGADPMGPRLVDFGAACPVCTGADVYAVHEAVVPLVDEGGDIVLPHLYAVCCDCYRAQYVQKYGPPVAVCGCQDVDLQALARAHQPPVTAPPIGVNDSTVTVA